MRDITFIAVFRLYEFACMWIPLDCSAIVQRKKSLLARVGVLRLCGNATIALPPFASIPASLAAVIKGHSAMVAGGFEVDGRTAVEPNEDEIRQFARTCFEKKVRCIVCSGVFSPVNAAQERYAENIIRDELHNLLETENAHSSGFAVTKSSDVAGMGLLEREAAAVLNACVIPLAQRTIASLRASLRDLGAPLFLTQNDGTAASADDALRLPIRTFASGPTNSMRGAAWLTGLQDGIVIDVGGTTSDVGALVRGFPRSSGVHATIAGVETNFLMPDTTSIGLGGGSHVRVGGASVGPTSVGHLLSTEALCFGGNTVTATDCAIVMGREDAVGIGDAKSARAGLTDVDAQVAWRTMQNSFEKLIDREKTSADDVPVIVVGGGAILVGDTLRGASHLYRPKLGGVANAVGAAICQVSGTIDIIKDLSGPDGRSRAFDEAEREAVAKAVAAGAIPHTVIVTEREEIPLAYFPGESARILVKAVGDLELSGARDSDTVVDPAGSAEEAKEDEDFIPLSDGGDEHGEDINAMASDATHPPSPGLPPDTVHVDDQGFWVLCGNDVYAIAIGAGILGTGGGGNAFRPALAIRKHLETNPHLVLRVRPMHTLPDDAVILSGGIIGAPVVGTEKLVSHALKNAGDALAAAAQISNVDGLLCREIGGGNGIELLFWSLLSGIPAIDACIRGRAFPELQVRRATHAETRVHSLSLSLSLARTHKRDMMCELWYTSIPSIRRTDKVTLSIHDVCMSPNYR